MGIIKNRNGWERTAKHEYAHMVDDIVYIYTGIKLAPLVGVVDWDEDVVHAKDPRFTEYEYDAVLKKVQPFIDGAIHKRKEIAVASLWERINVLRRKVAVQVTKENESIPEDDDYLVCLLPKRYINKVTQGFLNPNKRYQSGVHNGTDWGIPIGTEIVAPKDGYISEVFKNHLSLGNACHFHFEHDDKWFSIRLLHLKVAPHVGSYKRGELLAISGNTGMSTGSHVHADLWKGQTINVQKIKTREGVVEHLLDPYEFFKKGRFINQT